ncbi:MAG TPA: FtsH protease activity modulator HflK [Dongiaceae bacterium]|jgi:membrane protease subunit HflK|nr:FtsH protease activity modulator HflK [Dongiaceae bacterium]
MAWNNQGGPWGGGGGGQGGGNSPWSRGPGGGGQPPDFEEMLRRGQDRMKNLVPGGMGPGKVGALIAGLAVLLWAASGLYQVQPSEVGVPLIFGKSTGETTENGLHWNWPAPIGAVLTPNVYERNQVEIGFRGNVTGSITGGNTIDEESLMLTGDENIVQVEAVVQWHIDDVQKYLFEIRDPNESQSPDEPKNDTVKNAAEAAIREMVGQNNFEYLLTTGRELIGAQAQTLAQGVLDRYNSGIRIDSLSLQQVAPPQEAIEAFIDVQKAKTDKDTMVNQANAYFNQVTQEAQGQAQQIIKQSEGYRAEKIAIAQGDTQRFLSVFEQYKKNPDVTSRRLYLETLEGIMQGMNKVLIDNGTGQGGAVPYLPLDQLMKQQKPASPRTEPQSSGAPADGSGGTTISNTGAN